MATVGETKISLPFSSSASSIIPLDSMPRNFRGCSQPSKQPVVTLNPKVFEQKNFPNLESCETMLIHVVSPAFPKMLFYICNSLKQKTMARTAKVESIDAQIIGYVSGLSNKNKQAVLTVVKTIAEAEHDAEFERKWAEGGLTPEQLRQDLLQQVRGFEWKK